MKPEIKIYGAERCHKTRYYKNYFTTIGLAYYFLDVEQNELYAEDLRKLYKTRQLNFPNITIGEKRLRNP